MRPPDGRSARNVLDFNRFRTGDGFAMKFGETDVHGDDFSVVADAEWSALPENELRQPYETKCKVFGLDNTHPVCG